MLHFYYTQFFSFCQHFLKRKGEKCGRDCFAGGIDKKAVICYNQYRGKEIFIYFSRYFSVDLTFIVYILYIKYI